MNLINEQSVTATTTSSTSTNVALSTAEARVESSLELVEFVVATSSPLPLPLPSSSLSLSSLTFSTLVCSSSSSSSSTSTSSSVESINKEIEKISSTLNSSDANQINLIRKMPTTTTPLKAATAGKIAVSPVPSSNTASNHTTTTTTATTVNIDDSVNDVSDCMKNKNGDKKTDINTTTSQITTTTTTGTTKPVPVVPSAERERKVGCEHYKRRAMFVTPCCNKFYKCRYCHDENETHHFDRKTLTELICVECNTRQKVQEQCEKCSVQFGKYTCLVCNLFDDEDKNQYHCDGCGICRIGGRENFFHCKVCNMCLPIELKIEGHRCVENISRSNCPVCLGAIHTSRIPCHIPDCGHLLHKMCFDQLLASGHYVCPTCQTSLLDMTNMWEYLDAQALLMTVPKKYENQRVYIFCNDCHETCKTKFHFVGLKCIHCGGYNTTQDVKRRMSWANGADSSTSA